MMNVKTREFLRALDSNRDGNVNLSEIKSLDQNNDGRLSASETKNQLNPTDLNAVNRRYQAANTAVNKAASLMPFLNDFIEGQKDNFEVYERAELNAKLFPKGVEGIHPNDIQQGGLGDCFFLASLASLVHKRPQAVLDMIEDQGNGRYRVKFPGAKYAVTVKDTDKSWAHQGRDANNQRNHSQWVQVLERAFVKYVGQSHTGTAKTKVDNAAEGFLDGMLATVSPGAFLAKTLWKPERNPEPADAQELFKWGGFQGDAVKILTGHSADDDILALTRNSTLRSKLTRHLNQGNVVTASTFMGGSDAKNIMDAHVYSVLAFDPARDVLTIRNPHGSGSDAVGLHYSDKLDDGIYEMKLSEFNDYFTAITYEDR